MPSLAGAEALEPRPNVRQRADSVLELAGYRLFLGQPVLLEHRQPTLTHASLREPRQLASHGLGCTTAFAVGHHPVDEPKLQSLMGAHRPPGEDHVHGPALADQPRQPDRPAVDQRYAPAP